MSFVLVVVRAFGQHLPGDTIRNPSAITNTLSGEHADYVVRVSHPVTILPMQGE